MQVLKLAAGKCVSGLLRKYGKGMAVGTIGLFVGKRLVRGVPIVGLIASPFLMLLLGEFGGMGVGGGCIGVNIWGG